MLSWFASVTCTCPKKDLDAFMATISTAAAVAKGPLAPLTPFSTWFFKYFSLPAMAAVSTSPFCPLGLQFPFAFAQEGHDLVCFSQIATFFVPPHSALLL